MGHEHIPIKKLLIWGLVLVAIALLAWAIEALVVKSPSAPTSAYGPGHTITSTLQQQNPLFAEAEQTLSAPATSTTDVQKAAQALELYKQSLAGAKDIDQRAQIEYKIARAEEKSGDYADAVAGFQAIAANTSYLSIIRAYAVTSMADMFYTYHDPNIQKLTFAIAPYNSMAAQGHTGLSYLHLFQYASSIYPIGLSEARIADWYATDLVANYANTSTTSQASVQSDLSMITQKLMNINKDLQRMMADQNAIYDAPETLQREAVVEGKLAVAGKGAASTAEDTFKRSQNLSIQLNSKPNGYTYFHYAVFLQQMFGSSRLADIQGLLDDLDSGQFGPTDAVTVFLTNERGNYTGTKPAIVKLANVDPKFKSYLETLGWTDSDFK